MLRSLTSRAPALARPRTVSTRAFALWTPRSSSSSSSSSSSDDRIHPALVDDPPVANPSTETDPWTLKTPPMPEPPKLDPAIKSMDDLINSPHPEGRDREPTETLRKRLVYESRKRGILEMDLILSTFARDRLANMSDRQLREYDRVSFFSIGHRENFFLLDLELTRPSFTVPDSAGLDYLLLCDRQGRGARTVAIFRRPERPLAPLGQQGQDGPPHARPRPRESAIGALVDGQRGTLSLLEKGCSAHDHLFRVPSLPLDGRTFANYQQGLQNQPSFSASLLRTVGHAGCPRLDQSAEIGVASTALRFQVFSTGDRSHMRR